MNLRLRVSYMNCILNIHKTTNPVITHESAMLNFQKIYYVSIFFSDVMHWGFFISLPLTVDIDSWSRTCFKFSVLVSPHNSTPHHQTAPSPEYSFTSFTQLPHWLIAFILSVFGILLWGLAFSINANLKLCILWLVFLVCFYARQFTLFACSLLFWVSIACPFVFDHSNICFELVSFPFLTV